MAKLDKVSEETLSMINQVVREAGLSNYINVIAFSTDKASQVIKVAKASATIEYIAKKESSVVVYVYEEAFDRLTDEQKLLLMKDAFNTVWYDVDKDKVVFESPKISITTSGRAKFGDALLDAVEIGLATIEEIEEERKEEKEARKAAKNKKKSNQ